MRVFVGVDPGKSGGVAQISSDGSEIRVWPFPVTERDTYELFARDVGRNQGGEFVGLDSIMVAIEQVHSMPGQGTQSTFSFGRNYGFLRCALIACEFSFRSVTPRFWQRAFGIKRKNNEAKTAWKKRLKGVAQEIAPHIKVNLKTADAILIAEWLRRQEVKNG